MAQINLLQGSLEELSQYLYFFKQKIKGGGFSFHSSKRMGGAYDYYDTKTYEQGDLLKNIDWKRWARTNRYYVIRKESERKENFRIIVDLTASVLTENGQVSRFECVRRFVFLLTHLLHHNQDRFIFQGLNDLKHTTIASSEISDCTQILSKINLNLVGGTSIPLKYLKSELFRSYHQGITFFVSDLILPLSNLEQILVHLTASSRQVVVVQILLPEEQKLFSDRDLLLTDPETNLSTSYVGRSQKIVYRDNFKDYFTPRLDLLKKFQAKLLEIHNYELDINQLINHIEAS